MTTTHANLPGIEPTEEELYDRAISMPLDKKVERAIGLLKMYERGAQRLDPDNGYYLCFSGGKDSCVIKHLAEKAGVQFMAHYNQTTIDPPEVLEFIREHHPDVEWMRLEKQGLLHRVVRYGPPNPRIRWCCQKYKEGGGNGKFKVVGVRAPESSRRKKLWKEAQSKLGSEFLAPICYWTDEDVWNYIRANNIPYCRLYDEGFSRLGCIGCPMAGKRGMDRDFARWPKWEAAWKMVIMKNAERRIQRIKDGEHRFTGKVLANGYVDTPEAAWYRWRNQVGRAKTADKCVYEEMLEQIGVMSIRELNESYYDDDNELKED